MHSCFCLVSSFTFSIFRLKQNLFVCGEIVRGWKGYGACSDNTTRETHPFGLTPEVPQIRALERGAETKCTQTVHKPVALTSTLPPSPVTLSLPVSHDHCVLGEAESPMIHYFIASFFHRRPRDPASATAGKVRTPLRRPRGLTSRPTPSTCRSRAGVARTHWVCEPHYELIPLLFW